MLSVVSGMQNKWYWDQYAWLLVSGMSGYCFEGPVVYVVSSLGSVVCMLSGICGQWYAE